MPRPREFDPTQALTDAMTVFWERGYAATSIEDLVAATGVSRYGLYGEWGDKHGLYLAALDYYRDTAVRALFAQVERADAGAAEIRNYLETLIELSGTEAGRRGCMMCNAVAELGGRDVQAAARAEAHLQRLRNGFFRALSNARARNEVASHVDPVRSADLLVGAVVGASLAARSAVDRAAVANMLASALDSLS